MREQTPTALLASCIREQQKHADFPTIWETLLKGHPLVYSDAPRQELSEGRSILTIRLVTGQRLVYDSERNEYRVG